MAELDVTIEVLSPIHLNSGQADVNVDAEIVHDAQGFPYFPAKRFKGLLYESALEVVEMFELSGLDTENLASLEEIFHRHSESDIQLIVPNFYILPAVEYDFPGRHGIVIKIPLRKVVMFFYISVSIELIKYNRFLHIGKIEENA